MPIYEFYCSDCHAIFNFLSRQMNISKRPTSLRPSGAGTPGFSLRHLEKPS